MKAWNKEATLHALCLKSSGVPSIRAPGQKMMTTAQAAAINEDVLKHASVEWREVEEGKAARETLRRAAGVKK